MKSNINETILDILDEMQINENEKEFFLDALNLEYENNTKQRPQLDGKYLELVKKHSD